MSEELQVAVINDPQTVAVPQPDIAVVVADVSTPVVITSPEVQVVTLNDEDHIVDEVRDIQIVTVGEVGPTGPPGADGTTGGPGGTTTGDVLRWNSVSGAWEVASEPLAFRGIVLTPVEAALTVAEGAVYYKASSKNIQVCTDAV